ncbi:MAG: N-formyl-4-amino-5-aminomethyl-2-methylpyrimidine deformylase [Chlamydiae bacterium]|nr:N-formyl-4-amino-5-aminomethyl-2-methylpyrimidine deformylase [Chlamydiota bacterium]
MATNLEIIRQLYTEGKEEALRDFFTFLKFQSISSESEHKQDVLACAQWLMDYLIEIGFETELWETSGHPTIFASHLHAGPDKPTILIYNHYDVQPVDPLKLWDSPPFDPTIKEGEIYARGAVDNKGQCFYVLQALKLLLKRDGQLPINVKLCIEGEEEVGSAGLSEILKEKKERLHADYLAIVDLGMLKPDIPMITLGVRGIVTMDVELQGSTTDLHSGSHGGIVYNPIHALAEVLAKCRDASGKITIPGFYDAVKPLSDDERSQLALEFDKINYERLFNAKPTGGERDFSPFERAWTRPTLEVNGISGGYTGKGFKTVIPSFAKAKISCRLVPNQDPHEIGKLVADFIKKNTPEGVDVHVEIRSGVGTAVRSDLSSKIVQAFSQAYQEVFQSQTKYTFEGGSIPIVNELSDASESSVVLLGLGLPGDQVHAPNEHFGIDRLEKGCLVIVRALKILNC